MKTETMNQEKQQAKVSIKTWFRDSTQEWIGEVTYKAGGKSGVARYTGQTEEAARNAAFAMLGSLLISTTWN